MDNADLNKEVATPQKQPSEVLYKKDFTRKQLCQSSKHLKLRPAALLKMRPWYMCFPVNFEKFLEHLFLQNTRLLLSDIESKYFTTSDHNNFMRDILDIKIKDKRKGISLDLWTTLI